MRAVILTVVVAACARTPAAREPASAPDAELAIRDVIGRTQAANNAGDVDGWVAQFADDAVYMVPGLPAVTTRDGLRDIARAGFQNRADIRLEPVEIVVAGEWAFARIDVTGSVTVHTGKTIDVDVKEIAVFRRQAGGAWKIARLINNSNR
jgi:uncharacterized protein (TIGR02246 family)